MQLVDGGVGNSGHGVDIVAGWIEVDVDDHPGITGHGDGVGVGVTWSGFGKIPGTVAVNSSESDGVGA
jgi:hypothetical protein